MNKSHNELLLLAKHNTDAASYLRDAICSDCRRCAALISDVNRQAISDLTDAERNFLSGDRRDPSQLHILHLFVDSVSKAFSAAMLLPSYPLPHLPPLAEAAEAALDLAEFAERLLTVPDRCDIYSRHLFANKGRGAHALLITHYCATDAGLHTLPLALALEAHRHSLERLCDALLLV